MLLNVSSFGPALCPFLGPATALSSPWSSNALRPQSCAYVLLSGSHNEPIPPHRPRRCLGDPATIDRHVAVEHLPRPISTSLATHHIAVGDRVPCPPARPTSSGRALACPCHDRRRRLSRSFELSSRHSQIKSKLSHSRKLSRCPRQSPYSPPASRWPLLTRPPLRVIEEDRGKATTVWVIMLFAFVGYVVYLSLNAVDSRENPPVQIIRKV